MSHNDSLDARSRVKLANLHERAQGALKARNWEQLEQAATQALTLLPEPQAQWNLAGRLFAWRGRARLMQKRPQQALDDALAALSSAKVDVIAALVTVCESLVLAGDSDRALEAQHELFLTGGRSAWYKSRILSEFHGDPQSAPPTGADWAAYEPESPWISEDELEDGDELEVDWDWSTRGKAALHAAAERGDGLTLKRQLDLNADPNAPYRSPDEAWYPLTFALLRDRVDLVEALLAAGASVRRPGWSAMPGARSAAVVRVLLRAGAGVDDPAPNGETALVRAVCFADFDLANALLDAGASRNARSAEGPSVEEIVKTRSQWADPEGYPQLLERMANGVG